jgi:uncharacterized membrane protein YbhN (UPF0104 family)
MVTQQVARLRSLRGAGQRSVGTHEHEPPRLPGPAPGAAGQAVGSVPAIDAPFEVGAAPRPSRRRRVVGSLLALLLAVEAVLVIPSLGAAFQALTRPDLGWLALAVLAAAASMGMFARLRRRLLRAAGVRVPLPSSVAAVYAANALHATLPGGAAFSTAYNYRWMRRWGASGPVATWSLAAGGLVSTVALAVVGLAGSLLAGGGRASAVQLTLELVGVVALATGARQLGRHPEWVTAAGRWGLRRVNRIRRRPPATGGDALDELVEQLRTVRPTGQDWSAAGALALLNWLFDLACLAACATAVGLRGLTLPLLLVAYTAGMAASSLSLVPGGIGVVDAALVLTLVAGGIPEASALPAVVLYRLISFVSAVVVGWAVYSAQVKGLRLRSYQGFLRPERRGGQRAKQARS